MSRAAEAERAALLGALAGELRQFHGLGASFFRAAAARIGMTVTDMQVIDLLESTGPSTAGQLADLTGLTTGAITGMLNRLEEGGLVRRERDPSDGRKVIVRLERGADVVRKVNPIFDSMGNAWLELASHYDDEQIAFLLGFLQRSNAMARTEIARLQEGPSDHEGIFSAPLGNIESGRLVVTSGSSRLTLGTDNRMTELYQARFEGQAPEVRATDGEVSIRYPRRLWVLGSGQRAAKVALSVAIPWRIVIQGQAAEITAELGGLNLAGLEVKGGFSMIYFNLPVPSGLVRIRISGAASDVTVRRPAGVAARIHLKGWTSALVFDDQIFSNVGGNLRLQSHGYDLTAPRYDIEVSSSAGMITVGSS